MNRLSRRSRSRSTKSIRCGFAAAVATGFRQRLLQSLPGAERSEYRGEQSRSELRGAGTLGIFIASSLRRKAPRPFRREGQRAPGFARYFRGSRSQSPIEIWSSKTDQVDPMRLRRSSRQQAFTHACSSRMHGAERSEYRGEQSRSELRGAGTPPRNSNPRRTTSFSGAVVATGRRRCAIRGHPHDTCRADGVLLVQRRQGLVPCSVESAQRGLRRADAARDDERIG